MSRSESQYLKRLAFLAEQQKPFPLEPYDASFADWSREDKARLTRAYHKGQLSLATDATAEKPTTDDYKTMARIIRPFVSGFSAKDGYRFDKADEWTPNKKRQLTRYYKRAIELGSRPFEVYHTTSKAAHDMALRLSGQGKGFPQFKGVLVGVQALGEDVSIHVDVKRATLDIDASTHSTRTTEWDEYGIDAEMLARDPVRFVREVVQATGFEKYAIVAGDHWIGKGVPTLFTARGVSRAVRRLVEKYSADKFDPGDPGSHYFGNWLAGLEGYTFDSETLRSEWGKGYKAESRQRKKYKSLTRKRIRYRKGIIK